MRQTPMTPLQHALRAFPLTDDHTWMLVVDLDDVVARWTVLRESFGPGWLHAIAIKAHTLRATLQLLVEQGAGLEAASLGELDLALGAACPPERIVFDSPVKTRSELEHALSLGVTLNADNLAELARIDDLLRGCAPSGRIGIRVNPELGAGRLRHLSVGVRNSKFGVSLLAQEEDVVAAFERYPWLTGLHVHIGSQGYAVQLLADGVKRVVELAHRCGAAWIDIGGGMAVATAADDVVPTMQEYADRLRVGAPSLFDGTFEGITEFGRWLFSGSTVAVSRVEYVKPAADTTIATIHFGGDLMIRHIYHPGQWYHPLTVLSPDGLPKDAPLRKHTIGGPLCFGGDVVAEDVRLPEIAEGDLLAVGNVGAYTFSMWSRYCSRDTPRIVGVTGGDATLLREAARAEFW